MTFGKFIEYHRKLSGFKSQRKLSEATSVSNSTVSRIEKGIHRPEFDTLVDFARVLHTTTLEELVRVCGYTDENTSSFLSNKMKINLNDGKVPENCEMTLDNIKVTNDEFLQMILYLKTLRSFKTSLNKTSEPS